MSNVDLRSFEYHQSLSTNPLSVQVPRITYGGGAGRRMRESEMKGPIAALSLGCILQVSLWERSLYLVLHTVWLLVKGFWLLFLFLVHTSLGNAKEATSAWQEGFSIAWLGAPSSFPATFTCRAALPPSPQRPTQKLSGYVSLCTHSPENVGSNE